MQLLGNDWLCDFWVSVKGYGGEMLSPSSGSGSIYINPVNAHVMTPSACFAEASLITLVFVLFMLFEPILAGRLKAHCVASQEIYYRQQPQKPSFDADVGSFD